MYKCEVELEQAALAPLAVIAFGVGIAELVDSCAKAIINLCVSFHSVVEVTCLVPHLCHVLPDKTP